MPTITNNLLEVTVPEVGAGIATLKGNVHGQWRDLMMPLFGSGQAALLAAPYNNRIRNGKFVFGGQEYQLARADEHALHGCVAKRKFGTVSEFQGHREKGGNILVHCASDAGDDYPFRFETNFSVVLYEQTLLITIAIRNKDTRPMPAGCCLHPQFPRTLAGPEDRATIEVGLTHRYPGSSPLPDGRAERLASGDDFGIDSGRIPMSGVDHCFRFDGRMRIRYPKSEVSLEMIGDETLRHVVIWTPEGEPFFAVEPASCAIDAWNLVANGVESASEAGMQVLQPDAVFSSEIRINVFGLSSA